MKPGKDYFNGNFFSLLIIFLYSLFFFSHITGVKDNAELTAIELDHFSTGQVLVLFGLMVLMLIERMLYRTRANRSWTSESTSNSPDIENGAQGDDYMDFAMHTLTLKMVIYAVLVFAFHIRVGFTLPIAQGVKLAKNSSLMTYYFLWVIHFVFAAL